MCRWWQGGVTMGRGRAMDVKGVDEGVTDERGVDVGGVDDVGGRFDFERVIFDIVKKSNY